MAEKIEINERIRSHLDRNNVQVDKLDRIENELLALYFSGEATAFFVHRSQNYACKLGDPGEGGLAIKGGGVPDSLQLGHTIVVVIPSKKGVRYVLQCTVSRIYADYFEAQPKDPRFHKRYRPAGEHELSWWLLEPLLTSRLQSGEVHLLRDAKGKSVVESIREEGGDHPPEVEKMLRNQGVGGQLVNISLSGICLSSKTTLFRKNMTHELIYLTFGNRAGRKTGGKGGSAPAFSLQVFALVKDHHLEADEGEACHFLHCMFITALPKDMLAVFPLL